MTQIMDAIELFLSPKAGNTKRAYRTAIDDFEAHCGSMEQVTSIQALKYFSGLIAKGKAGATIQLKFQALNSVYSFLQDMDMIEKTRLGQ
jgi:hypothetical protein